MFSAMAGMNRASRRGAYRLRRCAPKTSPTLITAQMISTPGRDIMGAKIVQKASEIFVAAFFQRATGLA